MSERRWIRVTATGNIPVREGRAVLIGDREIAVFNLGDRFVATASRCPHKNGPLCDGIVTGAAVVCPLHGWKVDLDGGAVTRPSAESHRCIETYPVRVEDGVIAVAWPAAPAEERVA